MAWKPTKYTLEHSKVPKYTPPLNFKASRTYFSRPEAVSPEWPLGFRDYSGEMKALADYGLSVIRAANIKIKMSFGFGLSGDGTATKPLALAIDKGDPKLLDMFFKNADYPMSCVVSLAAANDPTKDQYTTALGFSVDGTGFKLSGTLGVFMAGATRSVPAMGWGKSNIPVPDENSKVYLYVETAAAGTGARITMSADMRLDTIESIYIGFLTLNPDGSVKSVTTSPVVRWGTHRPSITNTGSAMPAKGGNPGDLTGKIWR